MTHRRYVPELHDPVLTRLCNLWKRTDVQMANEMGFSVSTIRSRRTYLGMAPNQLPQNPQPRPEKDPPQPVSKPNPVAVAATYLGKRLVEKRGGFWLDGRPVSLDTMMRECNRVRVQLGLSQILNNPVWRIET